MLVPFVVLYWLVPSFSSLTIGADYRHYPIEAQMEVNHAIEYGTFPLYAPGFAGGQSAAAMTLGQAHHPITHIARWIPGYWEGDALAINTVFRLMELGLAQVLLLIALRAMGLSWTVSFILSLVTVYNLRMLDHFRYGASLENHVAFLALGAGILLYFQKPAARWVLPVIFIASYLLVVGGHPQIAYLGFLSTALLALVAPFFLHALARLQGGDLTALALERAELIKKWGLLLGVVVLGMLSAAVYVLPFYAEFLASTSLRTMNPYPWSLSYQDSVGGILRNFYAPLNSDVMSAFGGSVLPLWLLISVPFVLFGRQLPKVIWAIIALLIISLLLVFGDATPVHYLVWKYFPLADSFRVPGRYSLWLIFPMLLLAVWCFSQLALPSEQGASQQRHKLLLSSAIVALMVYLVANFFVDSRLPESGVWVPSKINDISESIYDYWFYLGLFNFLALLGWMFSRYLNKPFSVYLISALCLGITVQTALSLRYGTWVESQKRMPTLEQMDRNKFKVFETEATPGFGLNSVVVAEQLTRSFLDPYLARLYRDVHPFNKADDMWAFLAEQRHARQAAILTEENLRIVPDEMITEDDHIRLLRASFNRFEFEVQARQNALFVSNIPYSDAWEARIDGQTVSTYRANGHELAVPVQAGQHQIVLRYISPATEAGLLISLLALCVFMVVMAIRSSSRWRYPALAFGIVLANVAYWGWNQSFYEGEIRTKYEWSSKDFPSLANIAYGKKAAASSIANSQMPYLNPPSKAVDGDRTSDGFVSEARGLSSWKLDLGQVYALGEVTLYGLNYSAFPISVWVSEQADGGFRLLRQEKFSRRILRVPVSGEKARYIAVSAAPNKALEIKEVEVYAKDPEP